MKNKLLPIGSVVILNNANKKLMITGFCITDKNDTNKKYDYCGCLYPEGIVDTSKIAVFNHNQIQKIIFTGLENEEEIGFKKKLNDILNEKIKK